jgi:hypothetical protein
VALCSWDNELNGKHKTYKEFEMATTRKTAAQKRKEEEAAAAEQEQAGKTTASEQAETPEAKAAAAAEAEEPKGASICEAFRLMERGAKMRRAGWSRHLKGTYVTIRRGETKPVLCTGKYDSPYTPSIVDAMTSDWTEIEEGDDNA